MTIDFKTLMGETKTNLKNLITKETSQEDIKKISDIDKALDNLSEAFAQKEQENDSLKDDLIASVKSTGFKVTNSLKDDSGIDQDQKSMDEILTEELSKISAKQN